MKHCYADSLSRIRLLTITLIFFISNSLHKADPFWKLAANEGTLAKNPTLDKDINTPPPPPTLLYLWQEIQYFFIGQASTYV